MRHQTEKTLARHAKKAKVATQDAYAKIIAEQIKTDAAKVLARLTFPRTYIAIITERGDWESVPLYLQRYVQKFQKKLSAMHDEAEGKIGDEVPIPFSFDMSEFAAIQQGMDYIRRKLKKLGKQTLDRQD